MTMTSYHIHFSMLFLPAKQALSIVIEFNTPFCKKNCHPHTLFNFFYLQSHRAFCKSKFSSQTNKFNSLLPTSFILKHSKHFTINSCFNSRWMISRVFTSVKPFVNVWVDIFVKIFGLNFICERVSVGEDYFGVILILGVT